MLLVSPRPNFGLLRSMSNCFRAISLFATHAVANHKKALNTIRAKLPIYVLLVSPRPKLQSVSSYGQPLPTHSFKKGASNNSSDHAHYQVKGTQYMLYKSPQIPYFNPLHSTHNWFPFTGLFETSAQNAQHGLEILQGQI